MGVVARIRRLLGRWPEGAWLAFGCACYGVALILLRPASPFEWDEVLFQGALDRYDVGAHSPHPPGYPAYVAAGRAVRFVVGDPLLALQLVGVLAAVGAVAAIYATARKLGARPGPAAAAAALLAVTPAFTFNANVGLSDVTGTAAAVLAVLVLLRAWDDPRAMPLAAAACAVGMAVRPQVAAAPLLLGVAVVFRAARARRWGAIALAALAGMVVSLAFWVPAVLVTGAPRFFSATQQMQRWMAEVEHGYRLPQAPLRPVAEYWLVRPFGGRHAAIALWVLVMWGAWRWIRAGRARLVAVAASAGFGYLLFALFTLNYTTSVRYILPAVPFLMLLAAGVLEGGGRSARRAALAVIVAWCVVAVAWAAPAYRLRRAPAPPWAALEWIKASYQPERTTVVYDGGFGPHAKYLLRQAGFTVVDASQAPACGQALRPDGEVVYVGERAIPGQDVLFARSWRSRRLRRLSRDRYFEAVVLRPAPAGEPCLSANWRLRPEGSWSLLGAGAIELPEHANPRLVTLRAGGNSLLVAAGGRGARTLRSGESIALLLWPGPAGAVVVTAPKDVTTRLDPIRLDPLDATSAARFGTREAVLPVVAHANGAGGSVWRSDVALYNPQPRPLELTAYFLAGGRPNLDAPTLDFVAPPGRLLELRDILGHPRFAGRGSVGALLVAPSERTPACTGDGCRFLLFGRTFNTQARSGRDRFGEGMPAVPVSNGLGPGAAAAFARVTSTLDTRVSAGCASLSAEPTTVALRLLGADRREIARRTLVVAPFSQVQVELDEQFQDADVIFDVVSAGRGARVVPYLSSLDRSSGMPFHRLPDGILEAVASDLSLAPLPRPLPKQLAGPLH